MGTAMDWIILGAVTVLFVITGYRKGALMMTWRLLAFVVGYVMAWKFTPSLAQWFVSTHKLQGVIVYPIAGLSLFLGTGIVFSMLYSVLVLLIPARIKEGGKVAGALLGGILGFVFALLCVWTTGIVQHALSQHQQTAASAFGTPPSSAVRQFAGKIMSDAAQAVAGNKNPVASATAQLLADPVSTSQNINYLAKQPDVRELFHNQDNYNTMINGSAEDIMKMPAFQQLTHDEKTMDFLSKAGLANSTDQNNQAALANNLSAYAKNIDKIKNTPQFQEVMADPEITAAMQAGNYAKLLTNEKVRRLTEMLTQGSSTPADKTADTVNNSTNTNTKNNAFHDSGLPQTVYRWKDKAGNTHYSDTPPSPSDVSGDVTQVTR